MRVFIALPCPLLVISQAEQIQSELKPLFPDKVVRWVKPENMHLTLKFIGEIPDKSVVDIKDVLDQFKTAQRSFTLTIDSPGCFPNAKNPRILWLGLSGELNQLSQLQNRIDTETEKIGFPREDKSFKPHLTLGRINTKRLSQGKRQDISRRMQNLPEIESSVEWHVDNLSLIQSHLLHPSGVVYEPLHEIRFSEIQ